MHKAKIYLKYFKEIFGLAFYTRLKHYHVRYRVELENSQAAEKNISLVIPLPSNTSYQSLTSDIEFSLPPSEKNTDSKYQNRYAVWNLSLKPQEKISLHESFSIAVKPRIRKENDKFLLDDYQQDNEYLLYTKDNSYINSNDPEIRKIAAKIAGKEKGVLSIIEKINQYMIGNLQYGSPIPGLYSANEALKKEKIDCGGYSSLFVSLANACKIPARILSGFFAGYKNNTMHAWAEFRLPNGRWLPVDSNIEQLRRLNKTLKFGSLGKIGSDRIVLSKGCDIPIKILDKNYHLAILQNPDIIADNNQEEIKLRAKFITY